MLRRLSSTSCAARCPRSISRQDADTPELLAEIMDLSDGDPHRLFAFV
jgi:hypothetical protein